MASSTFRLWLTFDENAAKRPLICEMSRAFDVIFNVRNASVTDKIGVIALELQGERSVVQKAVAWLEENGVQVEPVEINVIEG